MECLCAREIACQHERGEEPLRKSKRPGPLTDTAFKVGDAVLGRRSRIDDAYGLLCGRRTESFVQVLHSDPRIRSPRRGGRGGTLTHSGCLAQRVGPARPSAVPIGEEVSPARGCRRRGKRRRRGRWRAASWTGRLASAHLDGSIGRGGKRRVQVQGRRSCRVFDRVSFAADVFLDS